MPKQTLLIPLTDLLLQILSKVVNSLWASAPPKLKTVEMSKQTLEMDTVDKLINASSHYDSIKPQETWKTLVSMRFIAVITLFVLQNDGNGK